MIKLPYRNALIKIPVAATVTAYANAAIITINKQIGVERIYPKRMMIGMNAAVWNYCFKRFSSILTHGDGLFDIVQTIFIFGVHPYVLEIKCTVGNFIFIAVNQLPFKSAIIRFI